MQSFLCAIHTVESGQYLKININESPPKFGIHQIRIWKHGLKFRGIIYQRKGKEILNKSPLFAQDVVSILTYLCISRQNAALRLVDEPFMRDLNRDWYFTLNPPEVLEATECCDSHPVSQLRARSLAVSSSISIPVVLNQTPLSCPVCLTHLTPEHFVPAHD